MLTKEQALTEREFHVYHRSTKRCYKWRRNGQTKTWVRDPDRWELPVKYGLHGYNTFTNTHNPEVIFVASECPHHS